MSTQEFQKITKNIPILNEVNSTPIIQIQEHETNPIIREDHETNPIIQEEHEPNPIIQEEHETNPIIQEEDETTPIIQEADDYTVAEGIYDRDESNNGVFSQDDDSSDQCNLVKKNPIYLIMVDAKIQGFTYTYEDAYDIAFGIALILQQHGHSCYRTFLSKEPGKIILSGIHRYMNIIAYETVLHTLTIQEVYGLKHGFVEKSQPI